jgi:hypothetical protein
MIIADLGENLAQTIKDSKFSIQQKLLQSPSYKQQMKNKNGDNRLILLTDSEEDENDF